MASRVLPLSLGLLLSISCTRYEYQRERCPPTPPSRSAVAWQVVRSESLVVVGRVLSVESGHALGQTGVRLLESGSEQASGTDGGFRFVVPQPGRYTLAARRVGYAATQAAVEVYGDSAVVALIALEQRPVVLDGCGYTVQRVRKPWWKWW